MHPSYPTAGSRAARTRGREEGLRPKVVCGRSDSGPAHTGVTLSPPAPSSLQSALNSKPGDESRDPGPFTDTDVWSGP